MQAIKYKKNQRNQKKKKNKRKSVHNEAQFTITALQQYR